jgi:broad specificity phosphatase PhoE
MGVLLLVRHGQASLGTEDYDRLSHRGRDQARLVGGRFAGSDLRVDRVFCGALVRQRDTARAVMAELGVPIAELRVDARLDEYDHVGVLAGHRSVIGFEDATTPEGGRVLQAALDEAIARWVAAGGTGPEGHGTFIGRVSDVLEELTSAPGTTVAVSSAGVIAAACALALGAPVEGWPGMARMIVNASVTKLITGRTGTNLLTFNDHAHLEHDRSLVTYR